MSHIAPKRLMQHGFSVVEVMISLSVISLVLVGAFNVTKRSVANVRAGQEQSEMMHILQSQVELVRSQAQKETNDTGGVFASGNFCIATNAPYQRVAAASSQCQNIQGLYNVSVRYDTSDATSKVFRFTGTWNRIGGGTNNAEIVYRLYPG